jgi:hypothetical protein
MNLVSGLIGLLLIWLLLDRQIALSLVGMNQKAASAWVDVL